MRHRYLAFVVLLLSACATTEVVELSSNTIRVEIYAAQGCGAEKSGDFARRSAAIETLRRGFDRFSFTGFDQGTQSRQTVVSMVTGSSLTVVPMTYRDHVITADLKMFREGDRMGANATDARALLGPEWETLVKRGINTCN